MSGEEEGPTPEPAPSPLAVDGLLAPPAYHRELRRHLETTEPELWAWFAESASPSLESIRDAEVELLKTSYRLDGGMHDVLTAYAALAAGQLGLAGAITLYQELGTQERNARVLLLGDDVHIVFGGDLLELLDLGEQQAVLAHELAHVSLWQREDKAYWILDQMVHRLATDPTAADAVGETARRLRLHTEVFADAIAAELTQHRDDVIAAVVKVNSGIRSVDPDAYLRQARQILEADPTASRGWTHPELHVRVACLAARSSADPDGAIALLIEGPDDLDRIDLLGQLRLQELTGQVLACGTRVIGTDSDELTSHIELFPADVRSQLPDGRSAVDAPALGDGVLASREPSIRHLAGALLVDVALASDGRATPLDHIAPVSREADRLGVAAEFDKILARATDRSSRDVRKLRVGGGAA